MGERRVIPSYHLPKAGVRFFVVDNHCEKVGKRHQDSGQGRGPIFLSRCRHLASPHLSQSCQPQYKHSQLFPDLGLCGCQNQEAILLNSPSSLLRPTLKAVSEKQQVGARGFCHHHPTSSHPAQTEILTSRVFLPGRFIFRSGWPHSQMCSHT